MTRPLAAVTGATGFLGQHIVRALADDGWAVRILARRDPTSPFWTGLTPEVVPGGLGDDQALEHLCRGADVVVHAAGLISGDRQALQQANVQGARRVATAAGAGTRLLHISSLAARAPHRSLYAASKAEGEAAIRSVRGDQATIIRPSAVYGPGDRETLRLFTLAASSPVLPVLHPKARLAVIHVEDAARQIAWLAKAADGGAFTLSDARPEGYDWKELMQTAAVALGKRARLVRIPPAALYALAALSKFDIGWRKRKSSITFGKVKELTHRDWGVRQEEQTIGGPQPRFDLLTGFLQTIDWYATQKWL